MLGSSCPLRPLLQGVLLTVAKIYEEWDQPLNSRCSSSKFIFIWFIYIFFFKFILFLNNFPFFPHPHLNMLQTYLAAADLIEIAGYGAVRIIFQAALQASVTELLPTAKAGHTAQISHIQATKCNWNKLEEEGYFVHLYQSWKHDLYRPAQQFEFDRILDFGYTCSRLYCLAKHMRLQSCSLRLIQH